MRILMIAALAASAVTFVAAPAVAETCQQRANNCERLGGGKACSERSRMATCERTGQYTAPSGRVWDASASISPKQK